MKVQIFSLAISLNWKRQLGRILAHQNVRAFILALIVLALLLLIGMCSHIQASSVHRFILDNNPWPAPAPGTVSIG